MKSIMPKTIENAESRRLCAVLNLPELRSGRIPSTILKSAAISAFKTGHRTKINADALIELKKTINEFSNLLSTFFNKKVETKDKYLLELMDIIDIDFLNWKQIYDNVDVLEKPHYTYLQFSYYGPDSRRRENKPSVNLIKKYPIFFEQLRFELLVLAKKLQL